MKEDLIAPKNIDTLKEDFACPLELDDCGMDDSGICGVCSYELPPEEFDDPNLDKAKVFNEAEERQDGGRDKEHRKRTEKNPSKLNRPRRPSFSKAKSKAQFRTMKGICEGDTELGEKLGISKEVACEFVKNHQSPKGLPERVKKKDSTKKEAYWIPGWLAVIYHDKYGMVLAANENESHIDLSRELANAVGESPDAVYRKTFRGLYREADQAIAHMTTPHFYETEKNRADELNQGVEDLDQMYLPEVTQEDVLDDAAKLNYYKQFWMQKAQEEGLPVKKAGIVVVNPVAGRMEVIFGDPNYKPRYMQNDEKFWDPEMVSDPKRWERGGNWGQRGAARFSRFYLNEKENKKGTMKNRLSKITLRAHTNIPADESLKKLGWAVFSTPNPKDTNEKLLVNDGRKATNQPRNVKVLKDQKKPVTSRKRVADTQPEQYPKKMDDKPQYSEDTKGITEHKPGTQPEQYADIKKEDKEPQYTDGTSDIKEYTPGTQSIDYPQDYEDTPQYNEDSAGSLPENEGVEDPALPPEKDNSGYTVPGEKKDSARTIRREEIIEDDDDDYDEEEDQNSSYSPTFSESKVLAAMKLADLEETLGLDSEWGVTDKYARVAALESKSLTEIKAMTSALGTVKSAGLSRQQVKRSVGRTPSFRSAKIASLESNNTEIKDASIFA